jgi:hypothetical protein
MRWVLNFFLQYYFDFLTALVMLVWYVFVLEDEKKTPLKLIFLPAYYRARILDIRANPLLFPLLYNYFLFWGGMAMHLTENAPYTYFTYWIILFLYEINAPLQYLFAGRHRRLHIILLTFFLLLAAVSILKTLLIKDYEPINQADFVEVFSLFVGSIYVLAKIVIRDQFEMDFRAFFAFFGLALYSFLQCLATILIALDFHGNFEFGAYASVVADLFWLISIPWLKHLKSRLT